MLKETFLPYTVEGMATRMWAQIFAVDAVPERLAVAAELGAQPLLLGSTRPAHASGEADEEREAKRQKAEAGESAAAETPSMSSGECVAD